jgi:hypothetical protein
MRKRNGFVLRQENAVCARAGHALVRPMNSLAGISFPGGNTTFARHLVKALIPESMAGKLSFGDVLANAIDFKALDLKGAATRIRLGATVIRLGHRGPGVEATYEHGANSIEAAAGPRWPPRRPGRTAAQLRIYHRN